MKNHNDFLYALGSINQVSKLKADLLDYWGSDYPIMLFYSELGSSLVNDFRSYTSAEKNKIFHLIESVMQGDDEMMGAYVATGFLEALVSEAEATQSGSWDDISGLLGEKSKEYINLWNQHWGIRQA